MKVIIQSLGYLVAGVLCVGVLSFTAVPTAVNAAQTTTKSACGSGSLLGFPAWYRGLTKENGSNCDIKSPTEAGGATKFIWIIVLNVVEMILRAAGYAAVIFIIYGGYKYMISTGSPDGMVAARKTIMNAAIGLVISIAAVAIVRTVSIGLGVG